MYYLYFLVQILIADLNQPTGAVLSNGINSLRQHGRPSLYSPTASVIQQKQQTQEQQRGFVLVPTTAVFFFSSLFCGTI